MKHERWTYKIVLRQGKKLIEYARKRGMRDAIHTKDLIEQKEHLRKGTLEIIKNFI